MNQYQAADEHRLCDNSQNY